MYLSDIQINNEDSEEKLYPKLMKYYSLIRRPGSIQPSNEELFMHSAYSMSLRSKCISRKVGAIIEGERGYIVGAGWNEVAEGQIGCGDRVINDLKNNDEQCIPIEISGKKEFRKYLLEKYSEGQDSFCFREEYDKYILKKKLGEFSVKKELTDENQKRLIVELSHEIKGKSQQYCRALHAEENAIIQTSKIGGVGVRNGTLYTTTFPCELCAKKINQAGIKKIVYTEPYPESISEDVFIKDGIRNIEICSFEGVKSHSYYRLYKSAFDKKEFQKLKNKKPKI